MGVHGISLLFTSQPSGLEGYCRHGLGSRAVGWSGGWLPDLCNPYLCNRLTDFICSKFCGTFLACSCALLAHGPKTCQIWHKLSPVFAECRSLKPLDGLTPFKVLWNCLDLLLCTVILNCPFAPYGLAHGPKTCQMRQHLGQSLWKPLKPLDGFIPF